MPTNQPPVEAIQGEARARAVLADQLEADGFLVSARKLRAKGEMANGWLFASSIRAMLAFQSEARAVPAASLPADREAIARIIDPSAFKSWRAMFDHCLASKDSLETAKFYADKTHGPDIERALSTADAILAHLFSHPSTRNREGREMSEELKACPFCGCHGLSASYPQIIRERPCGVVECHTDNCYAMVVADTLPQAVKAWNRRNDDVHQSCPELVGNRD